MRVHIERRPERETIDVWVYEGDLRTDIIVGTPDGPYILQHGDGKRMTDLPPTFSLPDTAAASLLEQLGDFLPPSSTMQRHLADSIDVRDRLLALVEKRPSVIVVPQDSKFVGIDGEAPRP